MGETRRRLCRTRPPADAIRKTPDSAGSDLGNRARRTSDGADRWRRLLGMTSSAKIAANRRNARRSTGPRSAAGKARARCNAFRHGLATPASLDHVAMDRIDDLVVALTRDFPDQLELELATVAAEAQAEIERMRQTKVTLVNRAYAHLRDEGGRFCPPVSAPHWRSPVRRRSSWPASAMNAAPSLDAIGRCRRWQSSNENYGGRRQ